LFKSSWFSLRAKAEVDNLDIPGDWKVRKPSLHYTRIAVAKAVEKPSLQTNACAEYAERGASGE
jgi:hypothetical protein